MIGSRRRSLCAGITLTAALLVLSAWPGGADADDGARTLVPSARLGALAAAMEQPAMHTALQAPARGRPSLYKAALFSALVPGLGEYYAGYRTRALVFGTLEAGTWIAYGTFKAQENLRGDRATEFAVATAGALADGDDAYYSAMALFLRADGPGQWNEFVRRRARDTGEVVGIEYTGDAAWAWPTLDHFTRYRDLRAGALEAGDRATNMFAVALINRIASIVDVVYAMRRDSNREEDRFGLELQLGRTPGEPLASLALRNRF